MSRPRILRLLRIAFSVACGIVCLLLVVLWVRSQRGLDSVRIPLSPQRYFHSTTVPGHIIFGVWKSSGPHHFEVRYVSHEKHFARVQPSPNHRWTSGFAIQRSGGMAIVMPLWCAALLSGVLAALSWFRWSAQYSLRTLLIATTLVAVLLGLAVAMR